MNELLQFVGERYEMIRNDEPVFYLIAACLLMFFGAGLITAVAKLRKPKS